MEKWMNLKKYIYPGDLFLEEKGYCVYFKDLADYIKSDLFGIPNDKKLHTGLKPIPFVGDLEKASMGGTLTISESKKETQGFSSIKKKC